jgi:hypothetical protein
MQYGAYNDDGEYDLTVTDWRSFPGPDPSRGGLWNRDPRVLEVWAEA